MQFALFKDDMSVKIDDESDIYKVLDFFPLLVENQINLVNLFVEDIQKAISIFDKVITIEAAGGVVEFNNNILLIKRLEKWDLPKGKIELGENVEHAAIREVHEECGINVEIKHFLCYTFHTYILKNMYIIKKTHWYSMTTKSIDNVKPQLEEDITEVRFVSKNDINVYLQNTYSNIIMVLNHFFKS